MLAYLRRDRVVAVDTNPDWGSLGRRLVPDHSIFIDDLLAGPLQEGHLSAAQLDAQLGRGPDGLMVAPAPTDPERAAGLDETAYRTLFARLGDLVGTLVLDCGTGLGSPAARAALGCADQLVLVADGEPDTASLVAEAAARLEQHAPPLVLVANKLDRSSRVDIGALEREVPFARGIVRVPNHRAGADQLRGSRFSWKQAPARLANAGSRTRRAASRRLAAPGDRQLTPRHERDAPRARIRFDAMVPFRRADGDGEQRRCGAASAAPLGSPPRGGWRASGAAPHSLLPDRTSFGWSGDREGLAQASAVRVEPIVPVPVSATGRRRPARARRNVSTSAQERVGFEPMRPGRSALAGGEATVRP